MLTARIEQLNAGLSDTSMCTSLRCLWHKYPTYLLTVLCTYIYRVNYYE